jgi:hypothetical protein
MVDWAGIKANVEVRSARRTGSVEKYEKILHELMKDGTESSVGQLRSWIEAGLNEGRKDDEPKIKVNWITVQYVLDNKAGFKETKKNVYRYEPVKKKEVAKK